MFTRRIKDYLGQYIRRCISYTPSAFCCLVQIQVAPLTFLVPLSCDGLERQAGTVQFNNQFLLMTMQLEICCELPDGTYLGKKLDRSTTFLFALGRLGAR